MKDRRVDTLSGFLMKISVNWLPKSQSSGTFESSEEKKKIDEK